jgi:hypothetical protein
MRHARSDALDRLEPLLGRIRDLAVLREKSRGVFYRGATPFLHFHEDPNGLFADLRLGGDFSRHAVNTAKQQDALLAQITRRLS